MIARFSRRVMPVEYVHTYNALAAKRNAGASVARGEVVLFLDDDMYLNSNTALDRVISDVRESRAPVCFRVTYPGEWIQRSIYYRYKQVGHQRTNAGGRAIAPWRFVAMAFAMPLDLFRQVGGFDEEFKTYGCEDHAFEAALRAASVVPLLSPEVDILHMEDSRSFTRYRDKIVITSASAMPVLVAKWPDMLQGSSLQWMEGSLARLVARGGAARLLPRLSQFVARLLDRLPVSAPQAIVLFLARVFFVTCYLEGVSKRGRP